MNYLEIESRVVPAGYHPALDFQIRIQISSSSEFGKMDKNSTPQEAPYIACFCCLATDVPVVNAYKCNHTEFVKLYFKMIKASDLWICHLCHYMLKKIELFRFQIYKSFSNLKKRVPQKDGNWKLVNDLTKRNNVSTLSITKAEPEDPLENTNKNKQQEIEIKIEPECDPDTNSIPTIEHKIKPEPESDPDIDTTEQYQTSDYQQSPQTHTHTKTNIQTSKPHKESDTKNVSHTETSQNLKVMKMITLTQIRPKKNKNSLLKDIVTEGPLTQNYVKILKPELPKAKGQNSVIVQDKHEENKPVKSQEKRCQILITATKVTRAKQDDKIFNSQHKPSNIIDETYAGKIMQLTMTQEQLDKDREDERQKEYFRTAKYKCESCVKLFTYKFSMDRHNERQHKKAQPRLEVACPICNCVYSISTFKSHYKKHFIKFVCVVCNKTSPELPKLAQHFNQSHPEREPIPLSYWCDECDFKTDTVIKYRQHRKEHRTKKCNICNQLIHIVTSEKHMKTHHSGEISSKEPEKPKKSLKCDHCDQTYARTSALRNHIRIYHNSDANTYYCKKCDKQFRTEINYRAHLKQSKAHSTGDVFKYICDYCGKRNRYKSILIAHLEMEHLKTERFKCQPCNKVFGTARLLKRHTDFVHNKLKMPKNKICQYCGAAFSTKQILQTHIRTHTGERPLKCNICEMTFAHSASLYTHRRLKHKIPFKKDLITSENENK